MTGLKLAVIGAGWAGLAAAVRLVQQGHRVRVYEASRFAGGRARAVETLLPDGSSAMLDNGQHILIGAYSETLSLMRTVGVDPAEVLLRLPLRMQFADGQGIRLPDWPVPWDVLAGVLGANGWSAADKLSLLRFATGWCLAGFRCAAPLSVATLCQGLSPRVKQTLIEPLCVSALNTPPERASAQVFLRVLKDSLLGGRGSSNLLIPTRDLSALLPNAALAWLQSHGADVQLGQRVQSLRAAAGWQVDGEAFDAVVCAVSSSAACHLLEHAANTDPALQSWIECTRRLQFEAITTTYLQAGHQRLPSPMLALQSGPDSPAQFVFDRGQLGGPSGLLAFVVSASEAERSRLQHQVVQQARSQLSTWLGNTELQVVQTIVEKRATFACTPALQRPAALIAPHLYACGDYIEGPYPATLEGAIRSGSATAAAITTGHQGRPRQAIN